MWILTGILLVVSFLVSLFISKKYSFKFNETVKEILCIYLAVILLKYGFDKVFKAQFYLPEPNILYSRFGNLDKDILFWSTMGTSRVYSVLTGISEIFAAILLFFRKTKVPGLLVSAGIFLNIIFINLGFDISVKLFSSVLFLMTLFVLKDDISRIYSFLILKKPEQLNGFSFFHQPKIRPFFVFSKTAVLGLALAGILLPYFHSGNFNDDNAERPFLHGVFKVSDSSGIQYVFFHKNQYLILMDKNERTKDFHYNLNIPERKIILEDYSGKKKEAGFSYSKKDSILQLDFDGQKLTAKEQNWKKMNALKPLFHFSVESAE